MERHKEIRKIVLIITQACNLACVYCYEQYKSNQQMDFQLAQRIIDGEIEKFGDTHLLTIEFFGGEPFLKFDLIKSVFNYVQERYHTYNIRFCATTNGTLLSSEVTSWLAKHKDVFECTLSLDGTEEMHNVNRPYRDGQGSYSDINIDFFVQTYTDPRAKMTVSKMTLPNLFDGVKHIEHLGFWPVVDLAAVENYWTLDEMRIFEQQLDLLVNHYSDNLNLPICRMLDYDLRRVFIDKKEAFQYCGAGRNMITYDIDGNWYPCMALAPVSQGQNADQFVCEDFKTFEFREGNICKNCDLLRLCRNCYAANYNQTGDVQKQTQVQCMFNRMTIFASAKIQYNRIIKNVKTASVLDSDNELVLKAIWRIQEIGASNCAFL